MSTKSISSNKVSVTGLSHDGRGIAHVNGKTTFIFGALPGETVEFKYHRQSKRYDEAYVTEVIQAAAERVTPPCQHFGVCGGCSLQHLEPQTQILTKQKILEEQLQHIGNVSPERWLAPISSNNLGYRNKARLGVRYVNKKSEILIGFREKHHPRFITNMQSCEVLHPKIGHGIEPLKSLLNQLDNKRQIPQIEIAIGDDASALVIRHLEEFSPADIEKLIKFAKEYDYHMYLQPGKISSIHRIWPTNGSDLLSYKLVDYDLELKFHPSDFTQVNQAINQLMLRQALELLEPQKDDEILDLFCGLGNFSLPLAKHSKYVLGIEGEQQMISRAQANAQLNNLSNVEFSCANLFEDLATDNWPKQKFAKILLDPPRTGALEIVSDINRFAAKRIVYVSCNPATLARDAGELVHNQNYQLKAAGVMDMFPHTSHVESIALFEQR